MLVSLLQARALYRIILVVLILLLYDTYRIIHFSYILTEIYVLVIKIPKFP